MCDAIVIIREGEIIEQGNLAQLQHLSRLRIQVQTDKPLSALQKQPGIYDWHETGAHTQANFAVDHDALAAVLAALTPLGVVDLQSTPPTLEDLFLHYYSDQGVSHHAAQ